MRVEILNEVVQDGIIKENEWNLWFQWCNYLYDDGNTHRGYRFIWRRPDGSLQAARGQARIPSIGVAIELMRRAEQAGWGGNDGEA